MSGCLIIQTSCHIKFTIIPPKLQPLQKKMFFFCFSSYFIRCEETGIKQKFHSFVPSLMRLARKGKGECVCARVCVCRSQPFVLPSTLACSALSLLMRGWARPWHMTEAALSWQPVLLLMSWHFLFPRLQLPSFNIVSAVVGSPFHCIP